MVPVAEEAQATSVEVSSTNEAAATTASIDLTKETAVTTAVVNSTNETSSIAAHSGSRLLAAEVQKTWTIYTYKQYAVEYYQYLQCSMLQMRPRRGLTRGGSPVEVAGMDFRYYPEYGVVPHCKFGD